MGHALDVRRDGHIRRARPQRHVVTRGEPRSHGTPRPREGQTATGRSPGSRVSASPGLPEVRRHQWHEWATLAGYSCGGSPGLRAMLAPGFPFDPVSGNLSRKAPLKFERGQGKMPCWHPQRMCGGNNKRRHAIAHLIAASAIVACRGQTSLRRHISSDKSVAKLTHSASGIPVRDAALSTPSAAAT